MEREVKIPIRRKILVSLLFAVTLVVSLITFTMANFFHDDKQAYIKDWVSTAAVSTAEETRALLLGYKQRLGLYAEIMLSESIVPDEKVELLQSMFDELPELIEIAVFQDGEELEVANERGVLEEAELTEQDLRDYREDHPLPTESILAGETWVGNTTVSAALPSFGMAFASPREDASPLVVSALFRADPLLRMGSRFKVFEVLLVDSDGVLLAHPDVMQVVQHRPAELAPEAREVHEGHRAGMTVEYTAGDAEMIGGFGAVDVGQVTVAVSIPRTAAFLASRDLLSRLMIVALALLLLVALAGLVWARRITRPVERLQGATERIARGEFDVEIHVDSNDEIGYLAGSFNQMASELKSREEALEEAQSQLVQSEKMAAFGQLGAGIAHEVKNPLAGVLGCAQLAMMDIDPGTQAYENLTLIEKETQRCKEIIENLLRFARQEKAILEPTDVNAVANDAMSIVNHQLEMQQVKLHGKLTPGLPLIHGHGNQLQQVLMNLMINAQQAMEGEPGNVYLTTRAADGGVEIEVRDDGPGIPPEIQAKLFEPFFTTKPTGKGTGLGLSVSFGIVQDHAGKIRIESEPGNGAAFIVSIPALKDQPHREMPEHELIPALIEA